MSPKTVNLKALPSSVGVNEACIAKKQEILHMMSHGSGTKWTITYEDGTPLFTVDGSSWSWTRKRDLLDTQGNLVFSCELNKSARSIYMGSSKDGAKLWQMELWPKITGTETELYFENMDGGKKKDVLEYKAHTYSTKKYVKYQGTDVAFISRKTWSWKLEYFVTIAEGMDMSLIVPIVIGVDDRVRMTNNAAAAGSASTSGAAAAIAIG